MARRWPRFDELRLWWLLRLLLRLRLLRQRRELLRLRLRLWLLRLWLGLQRLEIRILATSLTRTGCPATDVAASGIDCSRKMIGETQTARGNQDEQLSVLQ